MRVARRRTGGSDLSSISAHVAANLIQWTSLSAASRRSASACSPSSCSPPFLGGAIGLEREMAGKPAGLRTNILICVGAALFTQLSVRRRASRLHGGRAPVWRHRPHRGADRVRHRLPRRRGHPARRRCGRRTHDGGDHLGRRGRSEPRLAPAAFIDATGRNCAHHARARRAAAVRATSRRKTSPRETPRFA